MSFKILISLLVILSTSGLYAKSIKVMSYNVENLFDTVHDAGKGDWTFLPLNHPEKVARCNEETIDHYRKECLETDWTPDKLEIKLNQITKVIQSAGMPDILTLLEVENRSVVEKLRLKLGYKGLLITNSPDERGVDVAILFNPNQDLVFIDSKEHQLKRSASGIQKPTRNILEVNFKLKGKIFSLYANHWPSQQSGPGARNSAAEQLLAIIKPKLANPNYKVMLMGDFNVVDGEKPNPMVDVLLKNTGLNDVFLKLSKADLAAKRLPPGTYFYGWDFTWNRLDRVIVSNSFFESTPSVNPKSYNVHAPQFLTRVFEQKNPGRPHPGEKMIIPWSYWHNAYTVERAGFSDHFGVYVNIDL